MLLRYKIKPRSPLMSQIMSDTLFGHLCWAIRYEKGEKALESFLNEYDSGKAPIIFSSAFPENYLPRPVLPSPKRTEIQAFIKKNFIALAQKPSNEKKIIFEAFSKIKKWNKIRWLAIDKWSELKDGYSEAKLFELFLKYKESSKTFDPGILTQEVVSSNTINRETGMTPEEGGGLFQREKTWIKYDQKLDLYVYVSSEENKKLADWFLTQNLYLSGFGKDKSVGMGALEIKEDKAFTPDLICSNNANVMITLSMTAFVDIASYGAYYKLETKFGKLGGSFAIEGPEGGTPKPFKKPIMMMQPGAVFFTQENLNRKTLLGNVHTDQRIKHCGIPLTLPFHLMEVN